MYKLLLQTNNNSPKIMHRFHFQVAGNKIITDLGAFMPNMSFLALLGVVLPLQYRFTDHTACYNVLMPILTLF